MSMDPVTAGIDLVNTIVGKYAEAHAAKDDIAKTELQAELQLALAQIGVNTEEAKSTNWFVAGARPFLLWICTLSAGYHFILWPCLGQVLNIKDLAVESVAVLMTLLLTLIGVRSVDKIYQVDTK